MSDQLEDAGIPLEEAPKLRRPATVDPKLDAFITQYGEMEKIKAVSDDTLPALVKEVLALREHVLALETAEMGPINTALTNARHVKDLFDGAPAAVAEYFTGSTNLFATAVKTLDGNLAKATDREAQLALVSKVADAFKKAIIGGDQRYGVLKDPQKLDDVLEVVSAALSAEIEMRHNAKSLEAVGYQAHAGGMAAGVVQRITEIESIKERVLLTHVWNKDQVVALARDISTIIGTKPEVVKLIPPGEMTALQSGSSKIRFGGKEAKPLEIGAPTLAASGKISFGGGKATAIWTVGPPTGFKQPEKGTK